MARADFDDHLIRLVLKHERLTRGAAVRITPQGLVAAGPEPRGRLARLRGAALLLLAAFTIRALLMALMGGDALAIGLGALAA